MRHVQPERQLAFEFEAPRPVDGLAERLIGSGIAANAYLLNMNRNLQNFDAVPAPSRLYQFPLEFVGRDRLPERATSQLLLNHPALATLPFVRRVAAAVGTEPVWAEFDEFGRPRALPQWWHAIDLMTEQHWRHLMDTRHLTGEPQICQAVGLALEFPAHYVRGCRSGRIEVVTARAILAQIAAEEPSDRSEALLAGEGISPAHIVETHHCTGKLLREHWPINARAEGCAGAWMMVHGIEDGWFGRDRSGHLQMAQAGRTRRLSSPAIDGCPSTSSALADVDSCRPILAG